MHSHPKRLEEAMKDFGIAGSAIIALVTAAAAGPPAVAYAGTTASPLGHGPHYRMIDLGTFGGHNSAETQEFPYINNRGTVVGFADTATPDDTDYGFTYHAFRWRKGVLTDLGTLPGGRNSVANVVNDQDVAVGRSDSGIREDVAVEWTRAGRIVPLGSLGGRFGLATDINERGQIVGVSANATPDSNSWFGWPTQSRPFIWGNGVMRDLGTLGGPDAGAFYINERGQVAGASTLSTPDPSSGDAVVHPFLWQHGRMIDLGSFGGRIGIATGLNNRGQVVGQSDLAGDNEESHPFLWSRGKLLDLGTLGGTFGAANAVNDAGEVAGVAGTADDTVHAFFWNNGVKTDLGTVPGDTCSTAHGMNAKGQVVGTSGHCEGEFSEHGFLWQRGSGLIDLNAFVPPGSDLTMMDGETINDHGEIAGTGRLPNGDFHAVVLIPCNGNQTRCQAVAATKPGTRNAPQHAASSPTDSANLTTRLGDGMALIR
jgi:probable HAF family extracellular repeat protein